MQCVTSCVAADCDDHSAPPCHQSGKQAVCTHEVVLDVTSAAHFDVAAVAMEAPVLVSSIANPDGSDVPVGRGSAPPILLTLRI